MQPLIDIGFRNVGYWRAVDGAARLVLTDMADAFPALYAFAMDSDLKYVGKTVQPLGRRMYAYERGGASQRTNIRIREEIERALAGGNRVDIWAYSPRKTSRVGIFFLNLAAGLEDDIIRQLCPPWNASGLAQHKNHGDVEDGESATERPTSVAVGNVQPSLGRGGAVFHVDIGSTYYRQGFFNVPIAFSHHLDADGRAITIEATNLARPIAGRINRSVNSNGTPRIMGGAPLRDWLQDNVGRGKRLQVTVLAKNRIALTKA